MIGLTRKCRNCRHALRETGGNSIDGYCRRYPPKLVISPGKTPSGSFPPVNLDLFVCGEHRRPPFWRKGFWR